MPQQFKFRPNQSRNQTPNQAGNIFTPIAGTATIVGAVIDGFVKPAILPSVVGFIGLILVIIALYKLIK